MSNHTLNLDDALRRYLLDVSLREHPEQAALREATRSLPQAHMQISPEQGQLMQLLVKLAGARRTLEVGVFTGYSALTVALALPADGHVLACDVSEAFTSVGLPFWRRAGVAGRIELVLAPAVETLEARVSRGRPAPTISPSSTPTRPTTMPTSSSPSSSCAPAASSPSTTSSGAAASPPPPRTPTPPPCRP